jgi:hypothetical protein
MVTEKRPPTLSAVKPNPAFGLGSSEHLAADPDNEYAMIDSTIVCVHQHSADAKKADKDLAISR